MNLIIEIGVLNNMSNEKSNVTSGGIGFVGLLQIVFIVLKLCGVIDWSWWLVMLPLIIEVGFVVAVLFIGLVVILYDNHKEHNKKTEEMKEMVDKFHEEHGHIHAKESNKTEEYEE